MPSTDAAATERATVASEPGWKRSACILCECNCGIEVQLDGTRLARVRGDKSHPASAGYTCEKALRLDHYQNGRHRLSAPLRRRPDGDFEEIDWETALGEVSQRLGEVREACGGESIFFYGGGGQGNHLGGLYMRSLMQSLGARYRSNALAQEKTGEFWVDARMYNGHTRGDFEHAEVALFLGKNPWMSHGMPRARPTLREIARDPGRALIVIDPRRTETAELADHHLALRPGTDAWCLAALGAVIVQEGLHDADFLARHTSGADPVLAEYAVIDVAAYAERCGLTEEQIRVVARRIASAASVSTFEDLGMQQAPHSTLGSYLNKLLWLLVGSFGKPGAMAIHSDLVPITRDDATVDERSPVVGAPIIAGLVPANVVAEEILADHPARYRAMVIQSANPAHSVADSRAFRRALGALDLVVCVDVAFTETARLADYVLPAASQYEKAECTWFNLEFPHNTFHLRRPLLDPLPGTLPEAEIFSRIVEGLGGLDGLELEPLRRAAAQGRTAFRAAFEAAAATDHRVLRLAPVVLYRTLGPTLPTGCADAAPLWGIAGRVVAEESEAIARAGHVGADRAEQAEALFEAMLSGAAVTVTVDEPDQVWRRVNTADGRINLRIDDLLAELRGLANEPEPAADPAYPLLLAAGERRSFTANTIFRDPDWRRRDREGSLRVSPKDAAAAGVGDGDQARLVTKAGAATVLVAVDDTMPNGQMALPNGLGVDYPDEAGEPAPVGVAPNELTSAADRDPFAGTPWHKHVRARLEPVG